jgi:hypothetical protein
MSTLVLFALFSEVPHLKDFILATVSPASQSNTLHFILSCFLSHHRHLYQYFLLGLTLFLLNLRNLCLTQSPIFFLYFLPEQIAANYSLQFGKQSCIGISPVFVNIILLEHSHTHVFIIYGCFSATVAELSSCHRDALACKVKKNFTICFFTEKGGAGGGGEGELFRQFWF